MSSERTATRRHDKRDARSTLPTVDADRRLHFVQQLESGTATACDLALQIAQGLLLKEMTAWIATRGRHEAAIALALSRVSQLLPATGSDLEGAILEQQRAN